MRTLLWGWIACIGVASAGAALAAPVAGARDSTAQVTKLVDSGDYENALAAIDVALAVAPKDLKLLGLKGSVLLTMHDYVGALAAYEAYLAAGATGANQRQAKQIVASLSAVKTTSLDISLGNGPATVYLGSRAQGVFCSAAPSCSRPMLPDSYKVIAERPGFEVWAGRVTVAIGTTTKLAITLVEKPSPLTVRTVPPGAQITIDGAASGASAKVTAGNHQIVASLAGHADARREVAAHEGNPLEVELALTPLVPLHLEPTTAQLVVDGEPVAVGRDGLALAPGRHVVVVRAKGHVEATIDVPAVRPADYQIAVTLQRAPDGGALLSGRLTGRRKIALAAGGAGLAAVAVGAVLGVQSKQRKDDAFALCPSPSSPCALAREADTAYESGRSRARAADIAFGVAGAAVVAAGVLWLTGAPEARVTVAPRVGAVAGLDIAVRF